MTVPIDTRPKAGSHEDPFARGNDGRDDMSPPAPPSDKEFGEPRHIPWRVIGWTLVVLLLLALVAFAAVKVTNWNADKRLERATREDILRDLQNRILTEDLKNGQFVYVFKHEGDWIARWEANPGKKLEFCNLAVVPPKAGVPRYTTAKYKANPASFAALQADPEHAIGCLSTDDTDAFGLDGG